MAQIIRITSEALQATIRRLLPSQQGFGEDLQASNVITPIIDLTPTAEGSALPDELQQAMSFGGSTPFVHTTDNTIINTSGFYRVRAAVTLVGNVATASTVNIDITDQSTTKTLYGFSKVTGTSFNEFFVIPIDITVFLRANDSLAVSFINSGYIRGNYVQIADVNGNLNDPSGFQSQ